MAAATRCPRARLLALVPASVTRTSEMSWAASRVAAWVGKRATRMSWAATAAAASAEVPTEGMAFTL